MALRTTAFTLDLRTMPIDILTIYRIGTDTTDASTAGLTGNWDLKIGTEAGTTATITSGITDLMVEVTG